ncbi:uncharacterized protein LOC111872623 [Cryptotermes secundus]|uniref:uncharacterized protein LOC111872623 n=1 Tax=Cryptotermes secundus TaxID=105785 RepID=UPI001454D867|nr:uncharacterized protein LOC111872623 [Cryptotermes secundus]
MQFETKIAEMFSYELLFQIWFVVSAGTLFVAGINDYIRGIVKETLTMEEVYFIAGIIAFILHLFLDVEMSSSELLVWIMLVVMAGTLFVACKKMWNFQMGGLKGGQAFFVSAMIFAASSSFLDKKVPVLKFLAVFFTTAVLAAVGLACVLEMFFLIHVRGRLMPERLCMVIASFPALQYLNYFMKKVPVLKFLAVFFDDSCVSCCGPGLWGRHLLWQA